MLNQSISQVDVSQLGLPDELAASVSEFIERKLADAKVKDEWAATLESGTDEEIITLANKHSGITTNAIAFASYYEDYSWRYNLCPHDYYQHPRRPVIMRGSKEIMVHSRSENQCANRLCDDILSRWIRMKKLTILDYKEFQEIVEPVARELGSRFYTSYHFMNNLRQIRYWGGDKDTQAQVIVGGKYVWLHTSEIENIYRMREILKKTDKLTERLELLRKSRRY